MQQLTPKPELSTAKALNDLAEQVGGTYNLVTLVCRTRVLITLVCQYGPTDIQEWTMLNCSESVVDSVVVGDQIVVSAFTTVEDGFSNDTAGSYVDYLLTNGAWYGTSVQM
jgi:hypothetical protein